MHSVQMDTTYHIYEYVYLSHLEKEIVEEALLTQQWTCVLGIVSLVYSRCANIELVKTLLDLLMDASVHN